MKSLLATGLLLLLVTPAGAAAPAEKPPLSHERMGVANGCFVETVAFLDHWGEVQGSEPWARLLQWGAKEDEEVVAGHAVAICQAKGKLWCWDINFGWTALAVDPAQRDVPAIVAAPILTRYPKIEAQYPVYRFDFGQSPAEAPPSAQEGSDSPSLRDASIVAARLARHRPVNLIRFKLADGEVGAAAVFLYHGRYCVYVPALGTTPFRVRGGIENIRLLHDLLRRRLPGVTGLEKIP